MLVCFMRNFTSVLFPEPGFPWIRNRRPSDWSHLTNPCQTAGSEPWSCSLTMCSFEPALLPRILLTHGDSFEELVPAENESDIRRYVAP